MCKNAGYKPLTVPADKVNDGTADCCDGSDEQDAAPTPMACFPNSAYEMAADVLSVLKKSDRALAVIGYFPSKKPNDVGRLTEYTPGRAHNHFDQQLTDNTTSCLA